jgi:RNA polymerase sigma factor (sigma-70 family)
MDQSICYVAKPSGSILIISMDDSDDLSCLREYARCGSEAAFAAIVRRRVDMVYSAALRQVGESHLAEDVTQSVFIALARKSAGLASVDIVLSAWLLSATRLAALDVCRQLARRRKHEQRSAAIMPTQTHDADDQAWDHIRPLLDLALAKLSEKDRRAVVLRYFEDRSLREVGQAMGVSEEAARQRVWRAIGQLRMVLGKNGAVFPAAAVETVIAAHAIHAAPAALASTVAKAAVASGASATAAAPWMTKGLVYLMTTKTKVAVATTVAAVLLAASGTAMVYITRRPAPKFIVLQEQHANLDQIPPESDAVGPQDRLAANRMCSQNLRQIGLGILMYANAQKDGSLPPDLGTVLLTQDLAAKLFLDPRRGSRLPTEVAGARVKEQAPWINQHGDFLYFGAGRTNRMTANELLAMEKPGGLPLRPGATTEDIMLLFGDGHVETRSAPWAMELMQAAKRASAPTTAP